MRKSAERIRYVADPGEWPTVAEAVGARLFQSIDIGPLQLHERTWVTAMVPWRASEEGFVNDDVPSGPLLRIGDERFIPGLKQLVETVRRASDRQTRLFIQLIDFLSIRPRPQRYKYFQRFLTITSEHRQRLELPDAAEEAVREAMMNLSEVDLGEVLSESWRI